jgi:hypothetical protein
MNTRKANQSGKTTGHRNVSPKKLVCPTAKETPCPKKLNVVPLTIHVTDTKGEEHDIMLHS